MPQLFLLHYTAFYDVHGKIPTADDLLQIWDCCDLDLELPDNDYAKSVVIWYYDRWLPVVAGTDWWNPQQCYFNILTDKVEIGPNGDKKVFVTSSTEAFGVLIMDNCHTKWVNEFEYRKNDAKRVLPKGKDEGAELFKAKYTDSKNGQVKFGGWSQESFEAFQKYAEKIQKNRSSDKKQGYQQMKFAKDLVRKELNIKDKTPKGKKRKGKAKDSAPKKKVLKRFDE